MLDVFGVFDVAQAADHELRFGHFQHAAADVVVASLDGRSNLGDRNVVGSQFVGIDRDLVLLDETADAGHLGDAFDRSQFVLEKPVLDTAQIRQVTFGSTSAHT